MNIYEFFKSENDVYSRAFLRMARYATDRVDIIDIYNYFDVLLWLILH